MLANDFDPDRDPLVIVGVSQPPDNLGQAVIVGDKVQFTPAPIGDRDDTTARFTYTVTDGYDHEVTADISVVDPARGHGPTALRPRRLDVDVHEFARDDRRVAQRR